MPFSALPSRRLPCRLAGVIDRLLRIDELQLLYSHAKGASFTAKLLKELSISVAVSQNDLAKVPLTGPVVAISNHPHGILDGIVLAEVLTKLRPDVRILTNRFLADLPELVDLCFFIDPFGSTDARTANERALKQSLAHLRQGGLLLIFPAGEVSHFPSEEAHRL